MLVVAKPVNDLTRRVTDSYKNYLVTLTWTFYNVLIRIAGDWFGLRDGRCDLYSVLSEQCMRTGSH